MKLLTLITLFTLTAGTAFAAYEGPHSADFQKGTAQTALSATDDTKMILEGKIINRIGKEKYTFQDNTGKIIADIDDKKFKKITINENTLVRLTGKVDKGFAEEVEFEVKAIEIIQ